MLEDKLKNNEQLYQNYDSGNITQHCHSNNSSLRKFCFKLCSNSLHHLTVLSPWLIRDTKDYNPPSYSIGRHVFLPGTVSVLSG